jgi:hypothetical protein
MEPRSSLPCSQELLLTSILILYPYLRLRIPSCLFPTKILYAIPFLLCVLHNLPISSSFTFGEAYKHYVQSLGWKFLFPHFNVSVVLEGMKGELFTFHYRHVTYRSDIPPIPIQKHKMKLKLCISSIVSGVMQMSGATR